MFKNTLFKLCYPSLYRPFKRSSQTALCLKKHNALPKDFCEEVIARFEKDKEGQYKGRIGQLANEDNSIKKSTDLVVSGKEHWQDVDKTLFQSLGKAILEFRESYPFFKGTVQRYGLWFATHQSW